MFLKTAFPALFLVNFILASLPGAAFANSSEQNKAQFIQEYLRVSDVFTGLFGKLEKSKSGDEWDENYHQLQHFIGNPGSSKNSKLAMCNQLKSLSSSELEYLGSIVDSGIAKDSLKSCRSELLGKIEYFGNQNKMAFAMEGESESIRPIRFEERLIDEHREVFSNQGFAEKEVMLTFDDGPRSKTTPIILDDLAKAGVKAAFFNTGASVVENKNVAKRILSEGHILGSHTYYHTLMMGREVNRDKMAYDQFLAEMISGHLTVSAAAGYIDPFFRFPNGCSNQNMARNVAELGLKNFRWSVDSQDWQFSRGTYDYRRTQILKTFVAALRASHNRGIVLMHDIHQQTVDVLPLILNYLSDNGFKVVLLKPANRVVAPPGQNLPVVTQGQSYLKEKGLSLADILPEKPKNDEKGEPIYDLRFKTRVDFLDMYPQLTYQQQGYAAKATCDDH